MRSLPRTGPRFVSKQQENSNNRKSVININIWFRLIRFRSDFSVSSILTVIQQTKRKHFYRYYLFSSRCYLFSSGFYDEQTNRTLSYLCSLLFFQRCYLVRVHSQWINRRSVNIFIPSYILISGTIAGAIVFCVSVATVGRICWSCRGRCSHETGIWG